MKDFLKDFFGCWRGNDFEECLRAVRNLPARPKKDQQILVCYSGEFYLARYLGDNDYHWTPTPPPREEDD